MGLVVASLVGCTAPSPFDAEPSASDDGGALDEGGIAEPAPGDTGAGDTGADDTAPDDTAPDDTAPGDTGADDAAPDDAAPDDAAPDDAAPGTPEPGAVPDPGGPTDPDAPADPEAAVCNEAVVVAAGETIDGQIDALGAADFESALGFASRRFQAEVDPETFEAIITARYPMLLDDPDAALGRCARIADLARVEVTVTGVDGARDTLLYLLVREEGRWSIDGAADIDEPQREVV